MFIGTYLRNLWDFVAWIITWGDPFHPHHTPTHHSPYISPTHTHTTYPHITHLALHPHIAHLTLHTHRDGISSLPIVQGCPRIPKPMLVSLCGRDYITLWAWLYNSTITPVCICIHVYSSSFVVYKVHILLFFSQVYVPDVHSVPLSPREKLMAMCGQTEPLPLSSFFTDTYVISKLVLDLPY